MARAFPAARGNGSWLLEVDGMSSGAEMEEGQQVEGTANGLYAATFRMSAPATHVLQDGAGAGEGGGEDAGRRTWRGTHTLCGGNVVLGFHAYRAAPVPQR
eukprot:149857-Chlamydomonas_euryale.AAC.1